MKCIVFLFVFILSGGLWNGLSGQNVSSALKNTTSGDETLVEAKVYPNPADDYFQVVGAVSIKKIVIYNMFGKEVRAFFHSSLGQYDIADLKSGMYIVKMLDEKNKVLKMVKLHKSTS